MQSAKCKMQNALVAKCKVQREKLFFFVILKRFLKRDKIHLVK